jgi:hypothetical protein
VFSLLVPAVLAVGCDPFDRELSVREARKALERTFASRGAGVPAALAPNDARSPGRSIAIDAGALEGLWKPTPWREYFASTSSPPGTLSLELTDKGKQFFLSVRLRPLTYRWNAPDVVLRYIGRDRDVNTTARFTRSDRGWELSDFPLGDQLRAFRRDAAAEASGRVERENRCRQSAVTTELRGRYSFEHHYDPTTVESFELAVSDVGFTVTRHYKASGRVLQALTRSHFWGDVLTVDTQPGQIELTVLMGRDRKIGWAWATYRITVADDGKAAPPLDTAARDMAEAWTGWHGRFVGCLPEPTRAWDGR